MPRREPLETGTYYHIYNRSPHNIKIFNDKQCAIEFERALLYYIQINPPTKFSVRDKNKKAKDDFSQLLVTISAYCIMPTHFHILLRQDIDSGISIYLQRLQLSFSHYFNRLHNSHGSLFQGRFKAKEVSIHASRLYLSRYIHLNPIVANLTNNLAHYPHSSYKHYAHDIYPPGFNPKPVLGQHLTSQNYLAYLNQEISDLTPDGFASDLLIDEPGT